MRDEQTQMKEAGGKKQHLVLIRVTAALAVVILHTFHTASAMKLLPEKSLPAANMIRALCFFAVPCFVMVTGALLLSPQRTLTYGKLFKRYILKMAAAIAVFTIFFAAADSMFRGDLTLAASLAAVPGKIWTDGSWSHMWYLYTLTGLYLLMPMFRKVAAFSDRKDMLYLLAVGGVFLSVLPLIGHLTGTESGFRIAVTSVYPLFLFLGYAVETEIIKAGRLSSLLLLLAGAAGIAVLALLETKDGTGLIKTVLSDYTFPLTILMSTGVYGFLKSFHVKPLKILGAADSCGFGIYLIHLFWLRLLITELQKRGAVFTNPGLFALAAAVFLISFATVWLLRKIPGVRLIL